MKNKINKNKINIVAIFVFFITLGFYTDSYAVWNYYTSDIAYTVGGGGAVIGVTLSASPNTMTLPTNTTTLTWTTSGTPDSCDADLASGPSSTTWSGSRSTSSNPSPEQVTNLVAGSYVFRITCVKSSATPSSVSATALVVVSSAPTPTGAITASNCTISSGASTCNSSVTWTTSDLTGAATEVTHNNPNGTHVSWATSGTNVSSTVNHGATTFFLYHNSVELAQSSMSASCADGSSWNGSACQAVVVTPSVSLSVAPSSIFSGGSATLSWTSANVSSCTASASPLSSSWTGSRSTSSSYPHESTGSLYANTTFTLSCTGVNGSASDSETVTVLPDTGSEVAAALTANPERIALGESSTLSWTSNNATSCSGIGFSTGGAISGSIPVSPTVNTTYTVSCTDGSSSASDQATVSLRRKFLFIEF
ncbi:MAG TPA: hypothetical protein PLQ20_00010 [Candidatus Paceibacterota bacterium]|nr:hypothetical protein [Candidatus Paceibacterota bacterium]